MISTDEECAGEALEGPHLDEELDELRQSDEGEGGGADDLSGLQVEGVDLCSQARGEGLVGDRLQACAVDVPNAALRSSSMQGEGEQ